MPKERACANNPAVPRIYDIHYKVINLHGLLAGICDYDTYDLRSKSAKAAMSYVAEELADQIAQDMERLMDSGL